MTNHRQESFASQTTGDADDFATYRRTGDRALRDVLVRRHLGLAHSLAERYAGRGIAAADLHQVAALGLIKAVDKFDPHRGAAFSTFAVPTILGELRRHFRDQGWTIKVPRRLQDLRRRADAVAGRLEQHLQRGLTLAETAAALGEDPDSVLLARDGLRTCFRPGPLDTTTNIVDPEQPETRAVTHLLVRELMAALPRRQQQIVLLHYWRGLTQREIAERIGISQMHVSRLLREAVASMRRAWDQTDVSSRPSVGTLTSQKHGA